MPQDMDARLARDYWRALVENVAQLIDDAVVLAKQSTGRAWSLAILAQEELGKASHLYRLAADVWSTQAPTVSLTDHFTKLERKHPPKLVESFVYGAGLDSFWGDYARLTAEHAAIGMVGWDQFHAAKMSALEDKAKDFNRRKQAGFYVDRDGDAVQRPSDIDADDLMDEIAKTAAVAEMLLITDHSRMKHESPDRYETTHDLQVRFLMYAHPEDFFATAD